MQQEMQYSTSNLLLTEAFVNGNGPIDTSQASNPAPWIEVADAVLDNA